MFKSFLITLLITCSFSGCKGKNYPYPIYAELELSGVLYDYTNLGRIEHDVIYVVDTVDLKGCTCYLPDGFSINLIKGQIRNGELVGKRNKLICNNGSFCRVRIQGDWIVPEIKTSFFEDLSYDNSLCDVFALTSNNVFNDVYIAPGDYQITIRDNFGSGIIVPSKTIVTIDGSIRLVPNNYEGYNLLSVTGEDIVIKGAGKIIGEKNYHQSSEGEWGMGINIGNARRVQIKGLFIADCWGDCIYVGGKSKNIEIIRCLLNNGRRQGISVTSAKKVLIQDCVIKDVMGTPPQYGIDIEPNKGDTCDLISLTHNIITNCIGGIMAYGSAKDSYIGVIKVKNSTIEKTVATPLYFQKCKSVKVLSSKVINNKNRNEIVLKEVDDKRVDNLLRINR